MFYSRLISALICICHVYTHVFHEIIVRLATTGSRGLLHVFFNVFHYVIVRLPRANTRGFLTCSLCFSEADEGYYTCIAGNIMGETVSSAYLQEKISNLSQICKLHLIIGVKQH